MAENIELELILKGGAKSVKTLGELEEGLDQARKKIKGLERGSEDFEKLSKAIQDASSEIKVLEKNMEGLEPQQKAEAFLKMGEGIAGGFAVAQGALGLAGIESENLEKIQTKVQSAIAIATGVRMMSEAALMAATAKRVAVEKLAIVQSKLGLVVTKATGVATAAWATAQGVATGAVKLTTVAMKGLKLAIAATGIGALVLAIIAIGKAVYDWATATDGVAESQAKLNRELADQNNEFLKNRKLQQDISAANTESEKELARLNSRLQDNITKLGENSTELEENAGKLETLSDYSKENQKIIQNNSKILERNSQVYRDNINAIDAKIKKVQEEIDAEREREEEERERENRSRQRRSERKAKREREEEQLKALQEENQRMAIERIGDEETRELALLDFEKKLQLEKIKDAHNFEEQRLLIEEKFAQKRADVQAKYVDEIVKDNKDGLATVSKDTEDIMAELRQKELDRRQEEKERIEQIEANRQEFRETAHHQVIEQLQAHMGARMSELDKQMNKEIALAEAQGRSTAGIEQKFAQKKRQLQQRQKKIAVAQAIIATFESANQSFKAMSGIPFVGPGLGIAAAALAVSAGTANVRQILAQDVGGGAGGSAGIGGGGGFNATEPMVPTSTGAFTLGGFEPEPVKAFVVESEITDSQAQMADINRRSTI